MASARLGNFSSCRRKHRKFFENLGRSGLYGGSQASELKKVFKFCCPLLFCYLLNHFLELLFDPKNGIFFDPLFSLQTLQQPTLLFQKHPPHAALPLVRLPSHLQPAKKRLPRPESTDRSRSGRSGSKPSGTPTSAAQK